MTVVRQPAGVPVAPPPQREQQQQQQAEQRQQGQRQQQQAEQGQQQQPQTQEQDQQQAEQQQAEQQRPAELQRQEAELQALLEQCVAAGQLSEGDMHRRACGAALPANGCRGVGGKGGAKLAAGLLILSHANPSDSQPLLSLHLAAGTVLPSGASCRPQIGCWTSVPCRQAAWGLDKPHCACLASSVAANGLAG